MAKRLTKRAKLVRKLSDRAERLHKRAYRLWTVYNKKVNAIDHQIYRLELRINRLSK